MSVKNGKFRCRLCIKDFNDDEEDKMVMRESNPFFENHCPSKSILRESAHKKPTEKHERFILHFYQVSSIVFLNMIGEKEFIMVAQNCVERKVKIPWQEP